MHNKILILPHASLIMTDELEDQIIAKTENLVQEKKNKQAIASANELARLDPNDAIVWYVLGKTHYQLKDYDKALSALSKAATIDSKRPETWLIMGYTLLAQKRYEESIPSFEYVIAVDKKNVEATTALCIVHTILNNPTKAKTHLDIAMNTDKAITTLILQHFYDNFIEKSQTVDTPTKDALKELMQKLKFR